MIEILPTASHNVQVYKSIRNILGKPVDISRLPIIGESKILKPSAGRYGHVILKLDVETDKEIVSDCRGGLSYAWDVASDYKVAKDERYAHVVFLPIAKENFELEIKNEIGFFNHLYSFCNDDNVQLRCSVIGGSYKETERPYFSRATAEAIVQIFKQLHQDQ